MAKSNNIKWNAKYLAKKLDIAKYSKKIKELNKADKAIVFKITKKKEDLYLIEKSNMIKYMQEEMLIFNLNSKNKKFQKEIKMMKDYKKTKEFKSLSVLSLFKILLMGI